MIVRTREVLARPLAGVCVPLALRLSYVFLDFYVLNRVRLSNPLRPSPLPKDWSTTFRETTAGFRARILLLSFSCLGRRTT